MKYQVMGCVRLDFCVTVEADTEEEAEDKVWHMSTDALSCHVTDEDMDITDVDIE